MDLKYTEITKTQYKMLMIHNKNHFIEIALRTTKILLIQNVLTSYKKVLKSDTSMSLEDHQFR